MNNLCCHSYVKWEMERVSVLHETGEYGGRLCLRGHRFDPKEKLAEIFTVSSFDQKIGFTYVFGRP